MKPNQERVQRSPAGLEEAAVTPVAKLHDPARLDALRRAALQRLHTLKTIKKCHGMYYVLIGPFLHGFQTCSAANPESVRAKDRKVSSVVLIQQQRTVRLDEG